jgi:hypothetical protein
MTNNAAQTMLVYQDRQKVDLWPGGVIGLGVDLQDIFHNKRSYLITNLRNALLGI